MTTYKTFAAALTAAPSQPKAVNDNQPTPIKPKRKETRYRGTLPALKWLYENHPDLAEPVAEAVQALAVSNWDPEAHDDYIEIRPSIGELIRAATSGEEADGTPQWLEPAIKRDKDGNPFVQLGALIFKSGELVEYGRTKKDRKLEPRDIARGRADEARPPRNPHWYIFGTRPTTPSPLRVESYQRPLSGEPALPPMYDPQRGVEDNRAILRAHGVDGSVAFCDLPIRTTKCPTAIAKGAEFLGGVVQLSGNSSSGAVNMGDAPDAAKGEVRKVVESIAAGATLKDIGEQAGYASGYADRVAKRILLEVAKTLFAANDNSLGDVKKVA